MVCWAAVQISGLHGLWTACWNISAQQHRHSIRSGLKIGPALWVVGQTVPHDTSDTTQQHSVCA